MKFTDDELRELHSKGLNDGEIAKELGVHRTAVNKRRRKLGLEPNHSPPKFTDGEFKELYDEGMSDGEIAEELGVSKTSVYNRRKKLDLPPNRNRKERTKEGVIRELRERADELGRSPVKRDVDPGLVKATQNYFGSWNEAKEEAGLETFESSSPKHITTEEILRRILTRKKVALASDLYEIPDRSKATVRSRLKKLEREGFVGIVNFSTSTSAGPVKYGSSDLLSDEYVRERIVYTDPGELADFLKDKFKFELSEDIDKAKRSALTTFLKKSMPPEAFEKLHGMYTS